MELVIPRRIYESASLADIGSFTSNEVNKLCIVEHSYKLVSSTLDIPVEQTQWSLWASPSPMGNFLKISSVTVPLPVSSGFAITVGQDQFVTVPEVNRKCAAYLAHSPTGGAASEVPSGGIPNMMPIRLPRAEAELVKLNAKDTWNTIGLPCSEWLFTPQILAATSDHTVYVAFNTADARCIIFKRTKSEPNALNVFYYSPGVLEPALQKLGDRLVLFGRQPPSGWSVYFHNARYSRQYGPLSLPLRVAELDLSGRLGRIIDVSKEIPTESFIYAIASDGKQSLSLATVTGTKEQLRLLIYQSRDAGATFALAGQAALSSVPWRLTLALSSTRLLIGWAARAASGDEVSAAEIAWRK